MINYHNKKFIVFETDSESQLGKSAIFHYKQYENILLCTYKGGVVEFGEILGIVDKDGNILMAYHQTTKDGKLLSGVCNSKPEIDNEGKIILSESWQWVYPIKNEGKSILKEL